MFFLNFCRTTAKYESHKYSPFPVRPFTTEKKRKKILNLLAAAGPIRSCFSSSKTYTMYVSYPYRGISRNRPRSRSLPDGENTTHHHNTPHTNTRTLTTTRKWRGFVRKLRGFVRKLRGSVVDREGGQPTAMTAYLLLYGYYDTYT